MEVLVMSKKIKKTNICTMFFKLFKNPSQAFKEIDAERGIGGALIILIISIILGIYFSRHKTELESSEHILLRIENRLGGIENRLDSLATKSLFLGSGLYFFSISVILGVYYSRQKRKLTGK